MLIKCDNINVFNAFVFLCTLVCYFFLFFFTVWAVRLLKLITSLKSQKTKGKCEIKELKGSS